MEIEYKIIAVEDRAETANALHEKIEGSKIYWDYERRGCVWNKFRALRDINSGTTHVAMFDDDADVVNSFKEIVLLAVERFPDAIWSFYSGQITASVRTKSTPYVVLSNHNMRGIGTCIPAKYIQGYFDFFESRCSGLTIRGKTWPHEDCAWKMYSLLNRIPVMTTIPNLVKDLGIKSTLGHHITKNSDCWQGYDVDVRQFRTAESQTCYDWRLFDLHMPKDNPLAVDVTKEFNRQKQISKILRGTK